MEREDIERIRGLEEKITSQEKASNWMQISTRSICDSIF
jgi:hypothetical protein